MANRFTLLQIRGDLSSDVKSCSSSPRFINGVLDSASPIHSVSSVGLSPLNNSVLGSGWIARRVSNFTDHFSAVVLNARESPVSPTVGRSILATRCR